MSIIKTEKAFLSGKQCLRSAEILREMRWGQNALSEGTAECTATCMGPGGAGRSSSDSSLTRELGGFLRDEREGGH